MYPKRIHNVKILPIKLEIIILNINLLFVIFDKNSLKHFPQIKLDTVFFAFILTH